MKKCFAMMMAFVMLALCACGGSSEPKTLDMAGLAEKLKTSGAFEERISSTMESIKANKAISMLGADEADVQDAVYYGCVGATTAEILIFQCKDEEAAGRVYELADAHLAKQKEAYQSYAPEEAKKVDNAVKQKYGSYVIVVVSSDADIIRTVIEEATR